MSSKNTTKDILTKLILVIWVLGLAYFIYSIGFKLRVEAWRNAKYLSSVIIIEGQKTKATARPNGDALTGSSSPAYAEFDVNDSLQNLYEKTTSNLKSQGYTGDGYADTSYAGSGFQRVAIKMVNGTKSIVLEYNFKDKIICDETNRMQKPCYFDAYKDIYGTGLKGNMVTKLKVFYEDN